METKDIILYRGNLAEFREMYGKKSKIIKVNKSGNNLDNNLENDVTGCVPEDYSKTKLDDGNLSIHVREHGYLVDILENIGADSLIRYEATSYGNVIVVHGIPIKREHD